MNIAPAQIKIDGRSVRGYVATCKCGVVKSIPFNSSHHSCPQSWLDNAIARKLEEAGWKTLKPKDGPSCPSCVNQHRHIEPIIKAAEPMFEPSPIKDFKDLVTVPQELTKDNRRIILAKLEDVYVDEKTGYSAGWTDAKVAADLGVPRAWVTTLRADNFGPEGNEEIKVALADAKALLVDINKAISAFIEHNYALDTLKRRAEKIERTIIIIEKGLHS